MLLLAPQEELNAFQMDKDNSIRFNFEIDAGRWKNNVKIVLYVLVIVIYLGKRISEVKFSVNSSGVN